MSRRTRLAVAIPIPLLLVAACGGGSSRGGHSTSARNVTPAAPDAGAAPGAGRATSFTGWPTFHRTNGRSGVAAHPVSGALHRAWGKHLDGAVYGEPLIVQGHVLAATENDSVYALAPKSGKQLWRTHLGAPASASTLPCGNIDPLGITGTPAYDAKTGSVYVVAETRGGHHTLWALSAKTGGRRWHRSLDVLPSRNRSAEQERAALLVEKGRVITTFGGLDGDCDNYVGYVTSVATGGKGRIYHYAVPTSREAGMWATPGAVVGPNHNLYVAAGNGAETGGKFDKSDSVTELSPTKLRRLALFAPSTWPDDNARDLDLGSSSPVPVDHRIVIAGKRATVYLLKPSLGGVGGQLDTVGDCGAFGGAAHIGSTVLMPCLFQHSVKALKVGSTALRWSWSADGYASPVVAGKRVYVADRFSSELRVLSLRTGHRLASVAIGADLTHFPSVTISGNTVFVPTLSGVTAIRGS